MWWKRGLMIGTAALAMVVASACAGAVDVDASARMAELQDTPDMAVQMVVEDNGDRYAGDCAATTSPADIGKVCARQIDEQDGTRAYLIGRTFSEFTTWVFVRQEAAGWRVVATTPLDFFATDLTIPWPR